MNKCAWQWVISALLMAADASAAARSQIATSTTLVDAGGRKVNVRTAGIAKAGIPAVIFESGIGSTLDAWGAIPTEISRSTRVIVYERAGIGASDPGTQPRTIPQIIRELHALLEKINVPPPYVLVGHSYGGVIVRAFSSTFPKEVSGLVYVDPTDFTKTPGDMQAIWKKAGIDDGREMMRRLHERGLSTLSPGVRAEAQEAQRLIQNGFPEEFQGKSLDVPTMILLAGKSELPADAWDKISKDHGSYERFFKADLEQRIDHWSQLARQVSDGTFVLTMKSAHFIHATEPELVAWAIQRVLSDVRTSGRTQ
jgi:pimeloyl-ACP methyl ester carboxylesterase